MNLVEMIGKYVPADMLSKVGTAAGLGPDQTKAVASSGVPLVAAGLAEAGSTEAGAGRLLDLAQRTGAEDLVGRVGDVIGNDTSRRALVDQGGGLLSSLFGARGSGILDAFTAQTGAPRAGVHSFLGMLAPLALGVLGRHAHSQGLGAGALASMLSGQSGLLANMIPGGLGRLLGGAMPGGEPRVQELPQREVSFPQREVATPQREVTPQFRTTEPAPPAERVPQRNRFAVPAVAVLIGLGVLTWALQRQRSPGPGQAVSAATRPADTGTGVGQPGPAGQDIDALSSYPTTKLEGQRFSMNEVSLDTGTGKLSASSARQVDVLAGVMKSRPSMKVRLEGEQADSVRDALASRGVAAQRVETTKTMGQTGAGGTAAQAPDPRLVEVVVTGTGP